MSRPGILPNGRHPALCADNPGFDGDLSCPSFPGVVCGTGNVEASPQTGTDLNGNGRVDLDDAVILQRMGFNMGDPPGPSGLVDP